MSAPLKTRIEGLFSSPIALAHLLDEIPMGIMVLDRDRRILVMNPTVEVLTGYRRDEVLGLPCHDVLRSNFCPRQCPARDAAKDGKPVSQEGNIINHNRQKISVRMTSAPIRNASGDIVGFIETLEDTRPLHQLDKELKKTFGFGPLLGRSAKMEEVFKILPVVAHTDSSVLITGETGTGKDVLAESIHEASERAREAFIKVNCGALPETLLESELFGHKKGAFTGAVADKPGRLRLAHAGTLYLTEIGDLPLPLQVKLLTFLDDKVVFPLGSTKGFQADVRIIAATHRNLELMVREGQFREDLLFRLNVVQLHLPPLREREGDASLFMDHFLTVFSSRFGKKIDGFSDEVRQKLLSYPFPGNVRELRNIVEYSVNICQENKIKLEHLPTYLFELGTEIFDGAALTDRTKSAATSTSREGISGMNWACIERQLIVDALVKAGGRRNKAAMILGWGRSKLWRKMKQYGLET